MKYRLYDKDNDKYILPDGQVGYFNSNGYFVKCGELSVQLSTNGFDCDGTEIYEGDSLYLGDTYYGVVRYGNYYDFDEYDRIVGFYVDDDGYYTHFDPYEASAFKVKHENKKGTVERPQLTDN